VTEVVGLRFVRLALKVVMQKDRDFLDVILLHTVAGLSSYLN
jgi:hypothetical protein